VGNLAQRRKFILSNGKILLSISARSLPSRVAPARDGIEMIKNVMFGRRWIRGGRHARGGGN
jgi:hypothetical protein